MKQKRQYPVVGIISFIKMTNLHKKSIFSFSTHLALNIFLKVKFILGWRAFFRIGSECNQCWFVGGFITSMLPFCNSIFIGTKSCLTFELQWRNTKSRCWPKDSDTIGLAGSISFSPSRCSPMCWLPSSYLLFFEKFNFKKKKSPNRKNFFVQPVH